MDPEGSLPRTHDSSTGPYPDSSEFISHPHTSSQHAF